MKEFENTIEGYNLHRIIAKYPINPVGNLKTQTQT